MITQLTFRGRDAVLLKTVYKSPTTIHVFYFSADDPHLFPNIPPADPNVIRTQVDLQGWAIESLSPTTTLLTLLEQSDPKGWTGKTSIPTQMVNTVAGIGEFAIKCGGPPIVTRLSGSKANELRYDHEKGSFKVEYKPSLHRRCNNDGTNGDSDEDDNGTLPTIELETRCDIDTWGASLDIVVDPPPQTISCIRRHRLSVAGGGLWLSLTHDSILMDDERLLAIVRRAPGKEKGLVMVNGAKVPVDVEELSDQEIKALTKQKRIKPPRIPLDQPPVMGVIRRRKAEWNENNGDNGTFTDQTSLASNGNSSSWASAPRMSSPLARFWTYAVGQATTSTQQAVAAITPTTYSVGTPILDPTKLPMQYVLEALAWTQEFNSKPQTLDGWTLVYDKGITMHKKLVPEISPYIPVHKAVKVIEGVSAEELSSVIAEYDCRRTWDERYDSAKVFESYGGQAWTGFLVGKGGFPFRDRGFYVASVVARPFTSSAFSSSARRSTVDGSGQPPSARNTIFCVSASFSPEAAKGFSAEKYNPYNLPIGRIYLDAWILETLDPYTTENYAIPSTRCTRLVAVDYSGSIPAAVNSMINTTLARGLLAVEVYMKNNVKAALPVTRLPAPGLIISDKRPEEHSGTVSSASGTNGTGGIGGITVAAPFMAWKLRKRDENRVLVETRFDAEKMVYRSSVVVRLPSQSSSSFNTTSKGEPSSATRGVSNIGSEDANSGSATTTPRQSNLTFSHSPQGGEHQSVSDILTSSSGSMHPLTRGSATLYSTTMNMPGSMIFTPGLPSSSTFPDSLPISSLPTTSSPTQPFFPASSSNNSPAASAIKSVSLARGDANSAFDQPTNSSISASPPRRRQRAASSGSGGLHQTQLYNRAEGGRGRTPMTRSEMRQNTDLVVVEVVVDSKMFQGLNEGKLNGRYLYAVDVRARKRVCEKLKARTIPLEGAEGFVKASESVSTSRIPNTENSKNNSSLEILDLPFAYTLYTMPSSPLHSSGLSPEAPSRHLLRLTLPTAQYLVNSFLDPLAGEMREPPPKPEWMKILEGNEEDKAGGIVVDIVVRPWEGGKEVIEVGPKKTGKENAKVKHVVMINGKEVIVIGEKESLTSVGREELLDDRVAKMGILSR